MNKSKSVNVYVGEWDTYVVPAALVSEAAKLNSGKSLDDKRTRGAKLLNAWGMQQDKARAEVQRNG